LLVLERAAYLERAADFEVWILNGASTCLYGQKFFRFDFISPILPKVTTVLVMGRLMEAALRTGI